jgi:hypothetical protein
MNLTLVEIEEKIEKFVRFRDGHDLPGLPAKVIRERIKEYVKARNAADRENGANYLSLARKLYSAERRHFVIREGVEIPRVAIK